MIWEGPDSTAVPISVTAYQRGRRGIGVNPALGYNMLRRKELPLSTDASLTAAFRVPGSVAYGRLFANQLGVASSRLPGHSRFGPPSFHSWTIRLMADTEKPLEVGRLGVDELECSRDGDTPTETQKDNSERVVAVPSQAPPNGGLMAWLQVAGSFALYFNTL